MSEQTDIFSEFLTRASFPQYFEDNPKPESQLSPAELAKITEYLECPTNNGYWRLSGCWLPQGYFSRFVAESTLGKYSETETKSNRKQAIERSRLEQELIKDIATKISPLLYFFTYAREHKLGIEHRRTRYDSKYELFVSAINWDRFCAKFEKALKIFTESIYYDGFEPIVRLEDFSRLKGGIVCLVSGIDDGPKVQFASLDKCSLTALSEFLCCTGQFSNAESDRVFSPEEDLFEPYFIFLSSSLSNILGDHKAQAQVNNAFDYYKRNDYLHCVSTLGMSAEDYLTQVFETLLREPCPKGLTLGQIFDLLHKQIKDIISPRKETLTELSTIYEKIKKIEESASREALRAVLRDVTNTIKSDRLYFSQKIDDISKRDLKLSVFPKQLLGNIDELIRNRNAASHKTRVPIGRFETLRTLYCLTSLALWWQSVKKATQWADDRDTIIRNLIATY